jgi:hypothetical protein
VLVQSGFKRINARLQLLLLPKSLNELPLKARHEQEQHTQPVLHQRWRLCPGLGTDPKCGKFLVHGASMPRVSFPVKSSSLPVNGYRAA